MRTVKLVVIGASGVGKTSIRNQYISGRFTTGYRATIGADFITKTLPHHDKPAVSSESVTLQIWDTAGQERFSSLSSAFFRGSDAVILMFDVNQPQTLDALTKWWTEFKERCPVPDEELDKFCVVVVGNKIDVGNANVQVSEDQTLRFIDELIPPTSPKFTTPPFVHDRSLSSHVPSLLLEGVSPPPTDSIDIGVFPSHRRRRTPSASASRSHSRSTLFRGGTIGTMGTMTTTTGHSIYHTPSSSIFDNFESARGSPVPRSTSSYSLSLSRSPSHSPVRRIPSMSSISSAPTITPSLFGRERNGQVATGFTTPSTPISSPLPLPPQPDLRPKLFLTSAKTGEGVADIFEYIAKRVVMRWEYDEAVDARTLHFQEASVDDTIRLGSPFSDRASLWNMGKSRCCA
ncbi:hypothetical protein QCA50_008703 [Cerrena zonata]|uniref:Ras-domain-containing protein n=1 Tax=Cerrena zonata TaxID=2478898 RepID=A0AAW0G684_9APHY